MMQQLYTHFVREYNKEGNAPLSDAFPFFDFYVRKYPT